MSILNAAADRAFVAFVAALLLGVSAASAQNLTPSEARTIAEDAYVYGYSLITTEVTRVQMSNVPRPKDCMRPMGQFS